MPDGLDLGAVWTATTDELAGGIDSAQQRAYLRLTRLRAIVEDTALLAVPDPFVRDIIESRLREAITEALSRHLGKAIQVAVTVRAPEEAPPNYPSYPQAPVPPQLPLPPAPAPAPLPNARMPEPTLFDAVLDAPPGYPPAHPQLYGTPLAPIDRHPVAPEPVSPPLSPPPAPPPVVPRPSIGAGTGRDDRRTPAGSADGNRLNPKYTFETFVIGSSNRFAHSAFV